MDIPEDRVEAIRLRLAFCERAEDFDEPEEDELPAEVHDDMEFLVAELARLRAEVERLTVERDARPAITREDAVQVTDVLGDDDELTEPEALRRVLDALRAHARGGR